jgi:RNase adapter protein RapZ
MTAGRPDRILLVTGMSGAGKSTALKTFEDLGWETVDNLPFSLLERLLATRPPEGASAIRPLAIGIDSRTRGFDARALVSRIKTMRDSGSDAGGENIGTLFLDCGGSELERRYSETRRRHPLAPDRPTADGIARERELIAPLRRWADHVIDTTASSANELRLDLRQRFETAQLGEPVISVISFGFARGLPRNADLVFDMRYLRNPHWIEPMREQTGRDAQVQDYVSGDPAWAQSIAQIEALLMTLLPRYKADGKSYITIAFGCTGGRHRSVYSAEWMAERLRNAGFSPAVVHRDLGFAADTALDSGANTPDISGTKQAGR